MDDVVNRFAREWRTRLPPQSRTVHKVEACRERARAAGFEMKVTLEAVVRLREPLAVGGAHEGDHYGSGACGTTAPGHLRSPPTIGNSSDRFESQPTKRPRKSITNSSNAESRSSNRTGPVRRGGPAFLFGRRETTFAPYSALPPVPQRHAPFRHPQDRSVGSVASR